MARNMIERKPYVSVSCFADELSSGYCRHIANDGNAQILVDPANPSRSVSFNQARELVGKLATGFRRAGLKVGDRVLVNSGNDVREPQVNLGLTTQS